MEQFLAGFWWLIAGGVLVALFVLRKYILHLLVVAVLIAAALALWKVYLSPGFAATTQCFTDNAARMDQAYSANEQLAPGPERNRVVCVTDDANYSALVSCLKDAKRKNSVSFSIYSYLPQFRNVLKNTVSEHNKLCPDTPLKAPRF